jgi:hypothetical protein
MFHEGEDSFHDVRPEGWSDKTSVYLFEVPCPVHKWCSVAIHRYLHQAQLWRASAVGRKEDHGQPPNWKGVKHLDESSFLFKRLGHFKLLPWWISNHGDSKGKINAPSNYISERRTIQVTTAGRLTFFLSPDPPFPFVAEGDMDFRGRSKNLTIKGLSFSYIMKRGKCNHCRAAGIAMNMFMMISTTNPAMILILNIDSNIF